MQPKELCPSQGISFRIVFIAFRYFSRPMPTAAFPRALYQRTWEDNAPQPPWCGTVPQQPQRFCARYTSSPVLLAEEILLKYQNIDMQIERVATQYAATQRETFYSTGRSSSILQLPLWLQQCSKNIDRPLTIMEPPGNAIIRSNITISHLNQYTHSLLSTIKVTK